MKSSTNIRVVFALANCLLAIQMFIQAPIAFGANCSGPPGFGGCPEGCQECHEVCIDIKNICILEPLPGGDPFITPSTRPLENFWQYVNNGVWDFIFRIGVAIAVLNGVIGGFQIVLSNGDSGAIEKGRHRLIWSMVGLIILVLAGVIMEFINPDAYDII